MTSVSLFTFMHWRRKWQPTPVFLSGESQGWGSLVGCRLWGRTELNTTKRLSSSRIYSPWDSPSQDTGVRSLSVFQGVFPTQVKPRSPALQVDSLKLGHKGSPRIPEWVAYPFSSRYSQPRNQTGFSYIAGGFIIN